MRKRLISPRTKKASYRCSGPWSLGLPVRLKAIRLSQNAWKPQPHQANKRILRLLLRTSTAQYLIRTRLVESMSRAWFHPMSLNTLLRGCILPSSSPYLSVKPNLLGNHSTKRLIHQWRCMKKDWVTSIRNSWGIRSRQLPRKVI